MNLNQADSSLLIELHYLPSIAYCALLYKYRRVTIEQFEHYNKRSYRNRSHIGSSNGMQRLSIPLMKGKNQQQSIKDVSISYDQDWPTQHWRSIISAYGNSPYFQDYGPYFEPLFTEKPLKLFDFNLLCLKTVIEALNIEVQIEFTAHYEPYPSSFHIDYRNQLLPHVPIEESTSLQLPKYRQIFEEKTGFISNLSILDLIFCTGPEAVLLLHDCFH